MNGSIAHKSVSEAFCGNTSRDPLPAPSSLAARSLQVRPGGFDALRRRRIEQEGASPQQLKVSRVVRRGEHLTMLRSGSK